jgi:hypothetical protein
MTQKEFDKWADKACRFCYDKAISNEINLNFYAFQSEPLIDKQPELLILGLNPHGSGGYWNGQFIPPYEEAIASFSKGNPHVNEKDRWKLWQGLKRVFQKGNIEYMLQDDYPYMCMNILYFNTNEIADFNKFDKQGNVFRESVNLTAEFIQLLNPKRILCLSIDQCFDRLKNNFTDCQTLTPFFLETGQWENIPVYGIRHPSRTNKNNNKIEILVGKGLKYLFDKDRIVTADEFQQVFAKEIELLTQYKPNFNKEEKIRIASLTKDLLNNKLGLITHPRGKEKETVYTKDKKLYITVTQTGEGYIAIRHSDYGENGKKNYSQGIFYEKQEELIDLLSNKGYKESEVWLGKKSFIDYDTDDVPQAIMNEIEELMPLFDEIFK